jgi:hypothetical protein
MNVIKFTPHSNREDFEESWQAFDNGAAIDLTGATIVFAARDPDSKAQVLNASTDDGGITIATTTFTIEFSVDDVHGLCAKEYEVGCTISMGGTTSQFFVGSLPIVDGVVS